MMIFIDELRRSLNRIEQHKIEDAKNIFRSAKRLIFIGNGGSAAIASHMATDFTKNGNKRSIAFNDASLLTCFSNDFGHENMFAEMLKHYYENGDALVAISSSGRSKNILNAVSYSQALEMPIVTLSGFDSNNPLCTMGRVNFWIDSHNYGIVELTSEAILHSMIGEL